MRTAAFALLLACAAACGGSDSGSRPIPLRPGPPPAGPPPSRLSQSGTVSFLEIEGGCWGIEGDDGFRYQAVGGIPAGLRIDGKRVFFTAHVRTDMGGFCPGWFIQLESIQPL